MKRKKNRMQKTEVFTKEERARYTEDAKKHADFLCEKVFKPAFIMAFVHGAKHMKAEMQESNDDLKEV